MGVHCEFFQLFCVLTIVHDKTVVVAGTGTRQLPSTPHHLPLPNCVPAPGRSLGCRLLGISTFRSLKLSLFPKLIQPFPKDHTLREPGSHSRCLRIPAPHLLHCEASPLLPTLTNSYKDNSSTLPTAAGSQIRRCCPPFT